MDEKALQRHWRLQLEFRQELLERRYRRILMIYPADHRRMHAEEMIGVLLQAASDRAYRWTIADTANLLAGGLRIRGRMLSARLRHPRRRDGLTATYAVVLLLLVLAMPTSISAPAALVVIAAARSWHVIRSRA
jgi:hypothetical protein